MVDDIAHTNVRACSAHLGEQALDPGGLAPVVGVLDQEPSAGSGIEHYLVGEVAPSVLAEHMADKARVGDVSDRLQAQRVAVEHHDTGQVAVGLGKDALDRRAQVLPRTECGIETATWSVWLGAACRTG